MKTACLLCLLLFTNSATGFAQKEPVRPIPFRYLVLQTIDIMRELQIRPRKGVERDTPFIRYQFLDDTSRIVAFFGAEQTHLFSDTSKRFRYYTSPVLVLSKAIDSLLRFSPDTTTVQFIHAQSVIVHELTHYLQGHYDEPQPFPTTQVQYTKYLKLRSEQEAFAVSAYFFTQIHAPARFNEIMNGGGTMLSKVDSLVNYHFRTTGFNIIWKSETK